MAKKNKVKYYVVWVGQNPGVYKSWQDCQEQIKGFPNAKYKSFKSKEEADDAFLQSAQEFISKSKEPKVSKSFLNYKEEIVKDSISVDAACSGNPGKMEYRGVDTFTAEELFRLPPLLGGTNNVGEFLALVHGLALLKKQLNDHTIIYSDSRTAMSWVRKKRANTTLKLTSKNSAIFELIKRAELWLKNNSYSTTILKWDTNKWGEIPADFGRK